MQHLGILHPTSLNSSMRHSCILLHKCAYRNNPDSRAQSRMVPPMVSMVEPGDTIHVPIRHTDCPRSLYSRRSPHRKLPCSMKVPHSHPHFALEDSTPWYRASRQPAYSSRPAAQGINRCYPQYLARAIPQGVRRRAQGRVPCMRAHRCRPIEYRSRSRLLRIHSRNMRWCCIRLHYEERHKIQRARCTV